MKTATVRELRNHYAALLKQVQAGEEIAISQRGKVVARLIPDRPEKPATIDWSKCAAVTRDRSKESILTAEESTPLRHEASGRW